MFSSREQNWFTPSAPTAKHRAALSPFEDLESVVERQVRRMCEDKKKLNVQNVQFVLERQRYEQLETTVSEIYDDKHTDKELVQPMLAYYSTRDNGSVGKIVKHGYMFLENKQPTQIWDLRMEHGFSDHGFYCSPSFDVSKWHSFVDKNQDIQLIVNILVPGRTLVAGDYDSPRFRYSCSFEGGENDLFYGPLDSHIKNHGFYVKWTEYKHLRKFNHASCYHSIRSKDMSVWLSGSPDRLVPVAVVTVRLRPNDFNWVDRNIMLGDCKAYLKQHAISGSYVTFTRFGSRLYLVAPAHKATLYASYYSNPYTLLMGTVIMQHDAVDVDTMRKMMKWLTAHADTPASFLSKFDDFRKSFPELFPQQKLKHVYFYNPEVELAMSYPYQEVELDCSLLSLSREIVEEHRGLVPTAFDEVGNIPGVSPSAAVDFLDVASVDIDLKKIFIAPKVGLVQHFVVMPPSVLANHGVASKVSELVNSIDNENKHVALCESELKLIPIRNNDTVMQVHRNDVEVSKGSGGDFFMKPLEQLIDLITEENCNDRFTSVLYLFVNKPNDLELLDDFIHKWKLYLKVKRIVVKLVFLDKVYKRVLTLKSYLQTLPTQSCKFFFQASTATDLRDVLNTVADEIEEEQSLWANSMQMAVSHPLGVAGEGFVRNVAVQPSWEVRTNMHAVLFQGAPPEYVIQAGTCYRTIICDSPGLEDLEHFASCIFTLLAGYQAFMFQSQERIAAYGRVIEEMAGVLLEWIDKSSDTAPSVLRGLRYKLSGFLSTMETFGGVQFHGKWYTQLREMKFGKQVSRRLRKEFDLAMVRKGICFEDLNRIKEPSDALFFADRTGRLIRVKTFNSSYVEPWLVHVEYVSCDSDGSSKEMVEASETGACIQDSRGRRVTDVLLLDVKGDEIAKLYYGYVFTRTPYLYMPSQHPSLVVNSMTACIEKAFNICLQRNKGNLDEAAVGRVHESLGIAMDLVKRVQELVDTEHMRELIQNLAMEENVSVFLTTQYDIQSVNQVLAALLLPSAANLVESDRFPRICLSILAEAVMRNCRARVRSGKRTAEQLIDKCLLIRKPADTIDYKLNVKKSCRTTNAAMLNSFTNCSPFKAVAVLFFVEYLHQGKGVDDIADAFVSGEASMLTFLRENLPGLGGSITQLALYLQGLARIKAKYRQDIRFENPRAIVNSILAERLHHYHVLRVHEQRMHDRTRQRREIRIAEASIFRQYHTHPTLFTASEVKQLNKHRPSNDQLELMPNSSLLAHHCCYPQCPDYLRNFQSEKDKKRGTRRGLMKHLGSDMLIGNYLQGWHVQCRKSALLCSDEESFCRRMKVLYPSYPRCEEDARVQYMQFHDLFEGSR